MKGGGPCCICNPGTAGDKCEIIAGASSITVGFTTIFVLIIASLML